MPYINKFKFQNILLMNISEKDEEGFYSVLNDNPKIEFFADNETDCKIIKFF